jgi:hypothetical protein
MHLIILAFIVSTFSGTSEAIASPQLIPYLRAKLKWHSQLASSIVTALPWPISAPTQKSDLGQNFIDEHRFKIEAKIGKPTIQFPWQVLPAINFGSKQLRITPSQRLGPALAHLTRPIKLINFIFSPYKDITVGLDRHTYTVSITIGGKPIPLVSGLPANVPAITLAFATGSCENERWGDMMPDAFIKANIPILSAHNLNYIVSTGGAAGNFACNTPEGMKDFIERYVTKNLIGIDFDIEANQTKIEIENLVKAVHAIQWYFPALRFSFTLATRGSSDGSAKISQFGDLNAAGYNVIMALANFPIVNYTINLMVMNYGEPTPHNCLVNSLGRCEMGLTAIQAAKNLTERFGITNEHIEITPMIGLNDVPNEYFALADVPTVTEWARLNEIAGVHFWSLDRDTPCREGSASTVSPICSSASEGQPWSFTNSFASGLNF